MEDKPNRHTIKLDKREDAQEQTVIYDVKWTVPKFRELMSTNTMAGGISSSSYSVVKVPDSELQLKIYFYGIKSQSMKIYYLTTTSVFLKLKLNVLMGPSSIKTLSKDFHTVLANKWQCCMEFENYPFSRNQNSTLCISFMFCFSQDVKVDCHKVNKLGDDFINLLLDDRYSDVILKSAEGVEFRAHKNVLAIRSKVLKAQFEHNTKESITNIVETQWETEVLRDVLAFVYSNKAPQLNDHPEQLLGAADYYHLEELKSLCEEVIFKRLTVENAIDTIQLAVLYSLQTLKESVLEFIKDGRAKMVTKTQGWANFQSSDIIKMIFEFVVAEEQDTTDILDVALNDL